MGLLAIIGISLAWGFGISVIVIVAAIVLGVIFSSEAGQLPLAGFFFAPLAFVIGTFLAGLCQIRRARTLPAWGLVGYGLFLALLLFPLTLLLRNVFVF